MGVCLKGHEQTLLLSVHDWGCSDNLTGSTDPVYKLGHMKETMLCQIATLQNWFTLNPTMAYAYYGSAWPDFLEIVFLPI